jgi:hypothetical protein
LKKNRVIWIDRGWQPVAIGFVPSEKAWDQEMKTMGLSDPWPSKPQSAGHTQWIEDRKTGVGRIYVVISDGGERDAFEVISTIVHEAVHVWQFLCRHIGEADPGTEMEAYGIQYITEKLIDAYTSSQGKGRKWL